MWNNYRPHPAEEVYVTGTFDNWSKSEKLEKVGDIFQKTVTLPNTGDKIYYKVRANFPFSIDPALTPGSFGCHPRASVAQQRPRQRREPRDLA